MGLIDVAIPAVARLVLVACPGMFVKPARDASTGEGGEEDGGERAAKVAKFRLICFVLLGVAVLCAVANAAGR